MISQITQAQGVIAFGEALAVFIAHEFAVKKGRRCEPERVVEKQLARGGDQQIGATYHQSTRKPTRRAMASTAWLVRGPRGSMGVGWEAIM